MLTIITNVKSQLGSAASNVSDAVALGSSSPTVVDVSSDGNQSGAD